MDTSSSSKTQLKDVCQLHYFKENTLDETKILIFKILKELPRDIHQPILIVLDQNLAEKDYDFYLKNNEWHNNRS